MPWTDAPCFSQEELALDLLFRLPNEHRCEHAHSRVFAVYLRGTCTGTCMEYCCSVLRACDTANTTVRKLCCGRIQNRVGVLFSRVLTLHSLAPDSTSWYRVPGTRYDRSFAPKVAADLNPAGLTPITAKWIPKIYSSKRRKSILRSPRPCFLTLPFRTPLIDCCVLRYTTRAYPPPRRRVHNSSSSSTAVLVVSAEGISAIALLK